MSRRRARREQPRKTFPWPLALGGAALLAIAGWLVASPQSPLASSGAPSGAAPLPSFRPPDLHALVVAPSDERTVLFGHHQGMLVSRDGGTTWTRVSGANGDAMGIAMPPGVKTAFAAGHDVFFRSDDGGSTWRSVRPALPGTDIHGFAASATTPGTFYAYVVGSGLFRSEDAGNTWKPAGTAPGSTMSMAVARAGGQDMLFASTMEGVARSRDGGKTWERMPELGGASVGATGETLYAAAGNVVFVSRDGGSSWERRAFPRGGAALVASAPTNPRLVYVVTERLEVWRSSDGGASWERVG